MHSGYGSFNNSPLRSAPVTRLVENLSTKLLRISLLVNELNSLNKHIGAIGSSRSKTDLLNQKEKHAIREIEKASDLFTALSSETIPDHATKLQVRNLSLDFQRICRRFQQSQLDIKKQLLSQVRIDSQSQQNLSGDNLFHSQPENDDTQLQTQILNVSNDRVQELGSVLNREDQMRSLEEDIVNVNVIFQKLSTLVHEQGSTIDSIEDNITLAYEDQEAGRRQLEEAVKIRNRSRRRCCIFSLIVIVILIIVILILIIQYSPNH